MNTYNTSSLPSTIRIATRKSKLALWQAYHVADLLESKFGFNTEIIHVVTKGDRILDIPLAEIGGKGLFLKEIEETLLRNEADIAVHSMKDVPSKMTDNLTLAAMLNRENPSDALIGASSVDQLRQGAIIGTASLRRHAQILAVRPDLQVKTLRGNVDTRLAKLEAGEYDAIILATAGLIRLKLQEKIGAEIPKTLMLPAVAQGCVGIQCRSGDSQLIEKLRTLQDENTYLAVTAERFCNEALGGSCHAPIAVHGTWKNSGTLLLEGMVGNTQGEVCKEQIERKVKDVTQARILGYHLAETLFQSGAQKLLSIKQLQVSKPLE